MNASTTPKSRPIARLRKSEKRQPRLRKAAVRQVLQRSAMSLPELQDLANKIRKGGN